MSTGERSRLENISEAVELAAEAHFQDKGRSPKDHSLAVGSLVESAFLTDPEDIIRLEDVCKAYKQGEIATGEFSRKLQSFYDNVSEDVSDGIVKFGVMQQLRGVLEAGPEKMRAARREV
ncbi:MAG: hypothetical protein ACOC6Q_01200 [Patescibacteria group bacterium]